MMEHATTEAIDAVADAFDHGAPGARKDGLRSEWPYVPVVVWVDDVGTRRTSQIAGRAFSTRQAAIDDAAREIDRRREKLRRDLAEPRMRALREHHGLPREVT